MKRILLLAGAMLGMMLATASAQTIIDDLQMQEDPSEGVIRIESDSTVTALIGKPGALLEAGGVYGSAERTGYRIQVFMGNDPRSARAEATAKQSSIRNTFPELPAYLLYESPNWRLLVGDFMTREEANIVKLRLQREFPQFGKEMYVISDKIKVPVER
jgi:hypothetical protein